MVVLVLFCIKPGFCIGLLLEFLPLSPLLPLLGHCEPLRGWYVCLVLHSQWQSGPVNPRRDGRTGCKITSERVQDGDGMDLVFGCLRSRDRIPLPLTVTGTDSTYGVIGQGGYLGSGTMHLLRRTANSSLSLRRWAPRAAQKVSPSRQPCPPQFGRSLFPISRVFATHSMATTAPQSFSSPELPSKFGNFDLIRTEKLGLADIVVSKYRSRETGLTVVHLDYEGARWCYMHERECVNLFE